jgi:glycosyltransferase involved in cell wall biosynthesis
MACGKPVIVSRAGGAVELFSDGQDAVGVPPGDSASLASAIARLLDDADERLRLASQARQTAVARFSHDRLARDVTAAYGSFGKSKNRAFAVR